MTALKIVGASVVVLYLLWVHFLAVMKLRDIRDDGKLVGPLKSAGYTLLGIGYLLDFVGNLAFSIVMLNPHGVLHRTVSEHTKRLALDEPDSWRGKFSIRLRKIFLAPADKSGEHD